MYWQGGCLGKNCLKAVPLDRRAFLELLLGAAALGSKSSVRPEECLTALTNDEEAGSVLGAYGRWAACLAEDPPRLSLRRLAPVDLRAWQVQARARVQALLAAPEIGLDRSLKVQARLVYRDVVVEDLVWQLPFGPPTRAYLLRPVDAPRPLPGVLAFHDHGGDKFFGREKIVDPGARHPLMVAHQEKHYEGQAWANELARRGYVVLVPDVFPFGSRRIRLEAVPERVRRGLPPEDPKTEVEIRAYNEWAAWHEHMVARSLLAAGTTWPGVLLAELRYALDVLCSLPEVDPERIGCGGFSGGGWQTVLLAGMDNRIRCAVVSCMMTTWRDLVVNRSYTHTWMLYVPLLAHELDYPELLGLRVPAPTLVQCGTQDPLFTLAEMQRAVDQLQEVYRCVSAEAQLQCSFYDSGHCFGRAMQTEAFSWFDQWLKA